MVRRRMIASVASVVIVLGMAGLGSGVAGAASPIALVLPQGTAFSILGHWCGGIQEQAFATGFDATSGYPVGDVYLKTTCNGSGRGGRPTTYTAWAGATWDFTGTVVSAAALSSAPTVNPTFSAFDAHGNEVYNASNNAYLVLSPSFVPAPRVTGLSVTQGPAAGGTSVTITGTGFSAATAVSFGATSAASFAINGDTSITAVSPAASPGPVDVTVSSAGGPSATSASDQFTFVGIPSVSKVSPNSGPVSGGTSVTITGVNFTHATAVNFSDNGAAFQVNSDTSITATAPPSDAIDNVDVTVVSLAGRSTVSQVDQFTYTPALHVAISPSSGPPSTPVTVSGGGLSAFETVKVTYKTGLVAPRPALVLLCTTTAASDGSFSCSGTIPAAPTAGAVGSHKIKAKGMSSLITLATTFHLT